MHLDRLECGKIPTATDTDFALLIVAGIEAHPYLPTGKTRSNSMTQSSKTATHKGGGYEAPAKTVQINAAITSNRNTVSI
jgi:hypothetical protein